ncbi:MAG: outer membrane receptor protein involved in Fe transport [Halieaceae bacterium]
MLAEVLEEVRVVGQRDLLRQGLADFTSVRSLRFDEQVSLNRTVGDWIDALPGVSLNGQGGLQQSYSIRGFSRWRVRTEVDGVPLITDRRAGNSASFVPPALLGRATVKRGPGSTLYGSGAMGGVLGLNTLALSGLQLSAAGQSNDGQRELILSRGAGEGKLLALSLRDADRAEDPGGHALNSGYTQIAGLLKERWQSGDTDYRLTWLPSYARNVGKSAANFPDEQRSDYPEEIHTLARFEASRGEQWLLRAYHHYQDWESRTARQTGRETLTRYRAHTLGGLLYAPLSLFGGEGRMGAEWLGRRGVSIEESEALEGIPSSRQTLVDGQEDNLAAFLGNQWSRGELILSGGLRYDRVWQSQGASARQDARFNANAALRWQANPDWLWFAEVASGFRFPSLSELYFNGVTPRGETRAKPDLAAESSRAIEVGFRFDPGPVALDLRSYYNDLHNYIERYQVDESLRSYRNIAPASIWGFEAQLSLAPKGNWSHRISYQWQRGERDNGGQLADLNPPTVRYLLGWTGERTSLGSDLSYRPSRDNFGAGEQPLDAAWIWNARLSHRWSAAWQGEVYLNNITDERYAASADEEAPLQPGRIFGIRLRWSPASE